MKFATIGTSMITERFIEAAAESGKLTLKAVYSRDLEKATRFANQYDVKLVFNQLEQLATCEEIEVVYIASPNSIHYEQAIFLMEHGKHIICEKPMFTSMKEWENAFEKARKNNVFLFEAMRTIHAPNFSVLKNNLGRVGQIRSVNLQYMKYSSRYDQYLEGEVPNIFSAKYAGGALVDLGIYPLYMAISLFGEPDSSIYVPVMLDSGVDGGGTLVLQYVDFVCTIVCSKITDSYGSNEIHGEKGNIIFPGSGTVEKIEFIDRETKVCEPFSIEQTNNDMVYEIETFTDIIKTGDEERYVELANLSGIVLNIMEHTRKQCGIIFGPDKQ